LRTEVIQILEKVKELIPGFEENETPINSVCDYNNILNLTEEIRSEAYLYYLTDEELNTFISFADKILERIQFLDEGSELSFSVIDSILDSIWHQKKTEELSSKSRREISKLALSILNTKNRKYWKDDLSPSASSYNHCIYFIFMLEDRFRTENEEFETVFNYLEEYIEKYGYEHHLSKRWIKRMNQIKEK
jgi:hypothetical protein